MTLDPDFGWKHHQQKGSRNIPAIEQMQVESNRIYKVTVNSKITGKIEELHRQHPA